MSVNDVAVQLDSITKEFRDVTAVNAVDLEVQQGELLTLLGPSGCGKTTTLRMIAGFEKPTTGEVMIDGTRVTTTAPYDRDTGMVFQHYALFPHMTVADNIAFGLKMQNVPDEDVKERVQETLSMVRLAGMGDRYPSELSGGQQQRVALARALVIQPTVLLLDEPLSDLDKKLREEMRLEILRLHRELDVTMVYVTHNQEEALTISDRMAVMSEGEIHQVGTPKEIYRNPNDRFVADFIGNANLIEGTVAEVSDSKVYVELPFGERFVVARTRIDRETVQAGDEVTLLIRPEQFSISSSEGHHGDLNAVTGEVRELTYLGSRLDYFVDVNGNSLHVQQNTGDTRTFDQGDRVRIAVGQDLPFLMTEQEGRV